MFMNKYAVVRSMPRKKIIENRYNPRKKRQAVSAVSRRRSNFVAKEVHSALNEAEDAPISQETSL